MILEISKMTDTFSLSDKCNWEKPSDSDKYTNKQKWNNLQNKQKYEFENVYNLGRLFWKTSSSLPSALSYFANHQLKF